MNYNYGYDNNQWNNNNNANSSSGSNDELTDYSEHFEVDELTWETRDEMLADLADVAGNWGFILTIRRSGGGDGSRTPYVDIVCDKSGVYEKKKPSSVKSGTKKKDCPFFIKGYVVNGEWMCHVENGQHNHPPPTYLQGQARRARLTQDEKEIVKTLRQSSFKVGAILEAIKNRNPDNVSNTKTIHNFLAGLKFKERDGRNPIQELFNLLDRHRYTFYYNMNPSTHCLENLFFAHPDSIRMFKAFPDVLLMDCTYRTNRFNMSFLEVVGMTSTNQTYCLGFVFMSDETQESYIWALEKFKVTLEGCILPRVFVTDREMALSNALSVVFPDSHHILCTFHIAKNVLKNCRKKIPDEEWQTFLDDWGLLVDSESIEEYNYNRTNFNTSYKSYPAVIKYVDKLLNDYAEKFVACYTNHTTHLGNRTSNRAEQQHAKLKRSLSTNTGTLETVWVEVNRILEKQFEDIKTKLDKCKSYFPHSEKTPLFINLRSYITHYAFDLLFQEHKKCSGQADENCSCGFKLSHGLPCHHIMSEHILFGKPLPLEYIHPFWKKLDVIDDNGNTDDYGVEGDLEEFKSVYASKTNVEKRRMKTQLREITVPARTSVSDPEVRANRGRPRKGDKSSKRDKSGWEYVEEQSAGASRDKGKGKADETPEVRVNPTRRPRNQNPKPTPNRPTFLYSDQIWVMLHSYIETVYDVRGDGNCGFRVLANATGKQHGEDDWYAVRCELFQELQQMKGVYYELFENLDFEAYRYDYILSSLNFYHATNPAPSDKWMRFPSYGFLIASHYNMPIVLLSSWENNDGGVNVWNSTFLPLYTGPPQGTTYYIPTVMVFVNSCHYAQVIPKEGIFPMPGIIARWEQTRTEAAAPWKELFRPNFKLYMALEKQSGKKKANEEPIDLSP